MPQAGVSTRARRRSPAPWWEELDREAFRFPTAHEVKRVRTVARTDRAMTPRERAVAAPQRTETDAPARAAARPAPVAARPAAVAARPAPVPAPPAGSSEPTARPPAADGHRRTVTIRRHGAERNLPVARPTLRRHERPGFKADRAALWAVVLGLVLILVAAASAHAAVLH